MNAILIGLDALLGILRVALFAGALVVAAGAALSHAVRTRRLSPFSPVARMVRGSVDPLFAPVERRVLRSGGRPAHAPWWALAAVLVGGIVVLSLLGFLRSQLLGAMMMLGAGAVGIYALLVTWALGLLQLALFARVISSWFRLSPYSTWIRWAYTLTEWFMRPLRRVVPSLGMIDVTPIVAYLLLAYVLRPLLLLPVR